MTLDQLKNISDPHTISNNLMRAIWHELHNRWDTAHEIVQEMSSQHAKWIHAYLHRKEGDIGNSQYWYRSAGKDYPGTIDFQQELQVILRDLQSDA